MGLSILSIKVVVTIFAFVSALFSVLAPLWVMETSKSFFSVGNMMASGILLSAGLAHQLADSVETLNASGSYPWSMVIAGMTFIGFIVLEESIHILFSPSGYNHKGHNSDRSDDSSESNAPNDSDDSGVELVSLVEKNDEIDSFLSNTPESINHHHEDHTTQNSNGSTLSSLTLLMALSIHSVLEGVGIGIVGSAEEVTATAVAVLVHKGFAGYALGSAMVSSSLFTEEGSGRTKQLFLVALVFACASPLGVVIGITLQGDSYDEDEHNVGVAIMQAIVAGTFLYVAIIEVGMKELIICRHGDEMPGMDMKAKQLEAMKVLSLLAGFTAMSFLAFFV